MVLLRTYPYFFANLPLLLFVFLAAALVTPRRHGRLTLLCGCACLPCAALALIHEDAYWTPTRLGGLAIGVEDLVFTFVSGGLSWFLAGWPFRNRLCAAPRLSAFLTRALASGAAFGVTCALLAAVGITGLNNTLAGASVVAVILVSIRPRLFPLAAAGVTLFVPVYALIVALQFRIWPNYVLHWNPAAYGGASFLGVPMGEILWAAVFAATWPLMMGFFFDAGLK